MSFVLVLRLLKLRDELGPADVGRAQVLVVQTGEANVHQDLAQAVVHRIQHEALGDGAVGGRGSSRLKQLSGAVASEAFGGRVCGCRRPAGGRCEQLSGGAKQRPVFEGGAVEAEGGVVVPRCHCRTTWRSNGAEVWDVLAPFAHRRHSPGLR